MTCDSHDRVFSVQMINIHIAVHSVDKASFYNIFIKNSYIHTLALYILYTCMHIAVSSMHAVLIMQYVSILYWLVSQTTGKLHEISLHMQVNNWIVLYCT